MTLLSNLKQGGIFFFKFCGLLTISELTFGTEFFRLHIEKKVNDSLILTRFEKKYGTKNGQGVSYVLLLSLLFSFI